MAQLFPKAANSLAKVSLFGGLFLTGVILTTLFLVARSSYVTEANVARNQPVPFSHEHHVFEVGIDCRFCHTGVEESSFAGLPPTHTCMTCHSELFKDSPILKPVRDSYESGEPLAWTRVNDLPDFVYFNHSIHVKKGVACVTCHGPVDRMPLTWRDNAMDMMWCLNCHRNPEKFVGDPKSVYRLSSTKELPADQKEAWVKELHVKEMTNCSVCHR